MAKVIQFIKAESKTSKAGKPYTVNAVIVQDGERKEYVEAFGTVKEGDEGDLVYNEQYKKWEFKKAAQDFKSNEKQFKADPDSRESIEWQTSLKTAAEVARDYFTLKSVPASIEDYAKEVDKLAVHFKNLITLKPKSIAPPIAPPDEVPFEEDYA